MVDAKITQLLPELWISILTQKTYCRLLQTSKIINNDLYTKAVVFSILEDILGGGFRVPNDMNISLASELIPVICNKNYLYKLLCMDQKYIGELTSILRHLQIYKSREKTSLLHMNLDTKTLTYTTASIKMDLIHKYGTTNAYKYVAGDKHFPTECYYASQLSLCCNKTPNNMQVLLKIVEDTHTNAPNVLLFHEFYKCVMDESPDMPHKTDRPLLWLENIVQLGFDIRKIPFCTLDTHNHIAFYQKLATNEPVCTKILISMKKNLFNAGDTNITIVQDLLLGQIPI